MAKNCDNCGHCYIEQVIHVCGRNEGRLPLFDGDGNCKGWKQKHLTNADRIRNMSDEEMAEWIIGMLAQEIIYAAAKVPTPDQTIEARKWWIDWLRQECES